MKKIIASLIAGSLLIAALCLTAAPTPSPTPTPTQKVLPNPKPTIAPVQKAPNLPVKPVITSTIPPLKVTPTPKPLPTFTKPPKLPKPLPSITQFKPKPSPTAIKLPKPSPTPGFSPIKLPKLSPTPGFSPIKIPKVTPTPAVSPIKIPKLTPTPSVSPIKIPKLTPTPGVSPIKIPKPTLTPTVTPIKIPGKTSPTPTATVSPVKIPGKNTPTPTITPIKIPGKTGPTPTASPTKTLIPGKKGTPTPTPPWKKPKKPNDVNIWININVMPPPPTLLGPPIYQGRPPVVYSIPKSAPQFVDDGYVPVPESYTPPPAEAPVEETPTQLRAWNGRDDDATRAFDQTRVKVVAAEDQTMTWQFYWKTTGPAAQAARWEVATVPFIAGVTTFPPAGLVGYGDASVNAESPLTENFFAVDFNSFSANFEEGSRPNKYYMRVIPVDLEGNVVGKASNFIRVDMP
jgi:hypothetical protein